MPCVGDILSCYSHSRCYSRGITYCIVLYASGQSILRRCKWQSKRVKYSSKQNNSSNLYRTQCELPGVALHGIAFLIPWPTPDIVYAPRCVLQIDTLPFNEWRCINPSLHCITLHYRTIEVHEASEAEHLILPLLLRILPHILRILRLVFFCVVLLLRILLISLHFLRILRILRVLYFFAFFVSALLAFTYTSSSHSYTEEGAYKMI